MSQFHATTILAVHHNGTVVLGGDGQVTMNNSIVKRTATKIRSLEGGRVLSGFAGSAADAFALFERFEGKLRESGGLLPRAVMELAKDWRTDRYLRRLEAMMIVADKTSMFLLSGSGDVIQPDDGVLAIGSGGNYALAAARAILRVSGHSLSAIEVVRIAMQVASEICPFTNDHLTIEEVV